jgi:hypothetical protein
VVSFSLIRIFFLTCSPIKDFRAYSLNDHVTCYKHLHARNNRLIRPLDFLCTSTPLFSSLKTSLIARKITSSHPSPVLAEHSRYATAPILRLTLSAYRSSVCRSKKSTRREIIGTCDLETGFLLCMVNSPMVLGSSLRSAFIPTRRMGVVGRKWLTSGTH